MLLAHGNQGLLPPFFGMIDEETRVPSGSTMASGLLISVISFFFDLEFLANVISCGTLQVFTFVNAGVLLLRLRPNAEGMFPPALWVLLFVFASFGATLSLMWHYSFILVSLFVLGTLFSFGKIMSMQVTNIATFACPGVPVVPCVGILANVVMMASLPSVAW